MSGMTSSSGKRLEARRVHESVLRHLAVEQQLDFAGGRHQPRHALCPGSQLEFLCFSSILRVTNSGLPNPNFHNVGVAPIAPVLNPHDAGRTCNSVATL